MKQQNQQRQQSQNGKQSASTQQKQQQPQQQQKQEIPQEQPQQTNLIEPQIYQEIIKEEQKIFGMKYQPREKEPTMFEMLSWKENKQQSKDFKSQNLKQSNEMEKYKHLINKSSNHFQTEQRDNFRHYKYDKDSHLYIPEVESEVLSKLVQQQSPQKQQKKIPDAQQYQQQLSQQQGNKPCLQDSTNTNQQNLFQSKYQQDFGVKNIQNIDDLLSMVQQNHVNQVSKSKLLLEKAQEKKREQVNNYLYVKDEEEEIQRKEKEILLQQEREEAEKQRKWLEESENQENIKHQQKGNKLKQPKTKNVKSKLIKYKPQAKQLDAKNQKERLERRKERIKNMEDTTRWLPNSSFTTYFGKPAFENYGMGNVRPTVGGCIYGQYLLSHNVNPHRGQIQPQLMQSYNNALNYGERLPESEPQPPRNVKEDFRLSQKQVEDLKSRNPLEPKRNDRDNLTIKKPDLVNSLRFASNENSPVNTAKTDEEKRKTIMNELKQLKQHSQCIIKSQSQLGHDHKKQSVKFEENTQQNKKKLSDTQNNKKEQNQQQQQYQQQQNPQKQQQQVQIQQQSNQQQQQPQKNNYLSKSDVHNDSYELPPKNFMNELQQKKALKNRIALKVTEVVPERQTDVHNQQSQNQPPIIQQLDVPDSLTQDYKNKIFNPKLYKNVPSQYLQLIPAAGQKCKPHENIGFVFNHNLISDEQIQNFQQIL